VRKKLLKLQNAFK